WGALGRGRDRRNRLHVVHGALATPGGTAQPARAGRRSRLGAVDGARFRTTTVDAVPAAGAAHALVRRHLHGLPAARRKALDLPQRLGGPGAELSLVRRSPGWRGHHRVGLAVRPRRCAWLSVDDGDVRCWLDRRSSALWSPAARRVIISLSRAAEDPATQEQELYGGIGRYGDQLRRQTFPGLIAKHAGQQPQDRLVQAERGRNCRQKPAPGGPVGLVRSEDEAALQQPARRYAGRVACCVGQGRPYA